MTQGHTDSVKTFLLDKFPGFEILSEIATIPFCQFITHHSEETFRLSIVIVP